jgi:catechol 2,3-dioxygenase-like lactoylglutathione lyase family enzyme
VPLRVRREKIMVKVEGLQHIGILVPDVEKAAIWYIEKSGFYKRAEFYTGGNRVIFVYHEASRILCELIQRPKGSTEAAEVEKSGGKIDHIAYSVEDIEAEFEEAKKCGMNMVEGIVDIPGFWDRGFRYFLVRSESGEKVEYCKVL